MRVASLLLVLVTAKAAVLAGRTVVLSVWSPIAYFWHDAVVVLAFGVLEAGLKKYQRGLWAMYGLLACYTAINAPVARVLSTPLTWPMWRAARGPLIDSIAVYTRWSNVLLIATVLTIAVLAPRAFRRAPKRLLLAGLTACAALGPAAVSRVDTIGLERNAFTALVATAMPRVTARSSDVRDWRATSVEFTRDENLSPLRGSASGRNLIIVSLESTAAQYLGLYGTVPDVMPNLSALGPTAVVFDNAYAVYPESIKGLFSILCARYPAFDTDAEVYANVPCESIADALAANGYRTALFHSGRFGYLGMDALVRGRGFATLADAGDISGNRESSFGIDEDATVARILEWIDGLPTGQRFFVAYLPIAGHHPYESTRRGPYRDDDEFGRYLNALYDGDRALGALISGLRTRGLTNNTVWIIVGDHGEAFGQHDGNYGHTFHLYDENVRVPFLIAAPGLITTTMRARRIVSLVDTAPTALDVMGVRIPDSYEGRSMLDDDPRRALFFADYSLGLLGLRDGPWKFIYDVASGRSRLFDLTADPGERIDVASGQAARVREYAADVRAWSAAQRERVLAQARDTRP